MSLLSLECALKCCWRSASCACKLPENYFLQANCARSILVKLRSRSVILQLILEMAEKYKKVNCRMSQVFEPNFLLGLEFLVVSIIVITNRRMSFVVKYEWKGILSVFFVLLDYLILFGVGLVCVSLLLWRLRIVLWNVMRRIVVELLCLQRIVFILIELFLFPMYGIAYSKFVVAVAP